MALAIKCIHNLPPHLSYVSTLRDITQKLKCDIDDQGPDFRKILGRS